MKFNLITSANRSYYPFLEICLTSARANCAELDQIFVVDCGLDDFRSTVENWATVIDTDIQDEYSGVHSTGWRRATRSKTIGLQKLLADYQSNQPLILIDNDTCIIKDISQAINLEFSLQATVMSDGGHTRRDGIFIREIACFVCMNHIDHAKKFVDQWSTNIAYLEDNNIDTPHETPAFNFTLRDFEKIIPIGSLEENTVCADLKHFDTTLAVHFKSNGSTRLDPVANFTQRVNSVKNFTDQTWNYRKYLDTDRYERWQVQYLEK